MKNRIRQTLFLILMTLAAMTAAQAQIFPHFDCAEPLAFDGQGKVTQYRAWFGYENTWEDPQTIHPGPNNFFSPNQGGQFTGQQTVVFQLGYFKRSFSITINVSDTLNIVDWIVNNRPASSSLNPARFCDNGTTLMTYQGRLTVSGASSNSPHDFEFRFFNASTGGAEISPPVMNLNVPVTNGVFTTQIDLSPVFRKNVVEGRWMQIGVRRAGGSSPFEPLTPRQHLTAAPFAVNARNVSGGFVQIPVGGDSSPSKCSDATRGQMFFQPGQSRLYICSTDGWKSVTLQ